MHGQAHASQAVSGPDGPRGQSCMGCMRSLLEAPAKRHPALSGPPGRQPGSGAGRGVGCTALTKRASPGVRRGDHPGPEGRDQLPAAAERGGAPSPGSLPGRARTGYGQHPAAAAGLGPAAGPPAAAGALCPWACLADREPHRGGGVRPCCLPASCEVRLVGCMAASWASCRCLL